MADFIATDRSEMLVPVTNSFLFSSWYGKRQTLNYQHMQNFCIR